MGPTVSVIITTKNEEQNIGACLESIKNQTYASIETIVVDNASSDKTKKIAKEHDVLVLDKGPERSSQRNFGAKKAKGIYILFLDADMILTPKIIETCVLKIQQLKALIIPEISIGSGFWAQCKVLERSFYVGVPWIEAARFYRKDAFDELVGYDETLTGPEDFDMHQRLLSCFGVNSIGRIRVSILHNEGKLSLWKVMKKKFYYAQNLRQYAQKISNKGYYKKQANLFARYVLFFKSPLLLFRNPGVGFGMLILKTAEFSAGFCGLMYYSITSKKII